LHAALPISPPQWHPSPSSPGLCLSMATLLRQRWASPSKPTRTPPTSWRWAVESAPPPKNTPTRPTQHDATTHRHSPTHTKHHQQHNTPPTPPHTPPHTHTHTPTHTHTHAHAHAHALTPSLIQSV